MVVSLIMWMWYHFKLSRPDDLLTFRLDDSRLRVYVLFQYTCCILGFIIALFLLFAPRVIDGYWESIQYFWWQTHGVFTLPSFDWSIELWINFLCLWSIAHFTYFRSVKFESVRSLVLHTKDVHGFFK